MATEDRTDSAIGDSLVAVRRELAILCSCVQTRTTINGPMWTPQTVTNPVNNQPYTAASAWQQIAFEVSNGCALEIDPSDGQRPQYLLTWAAGEDEEVTVRLQRGATKIIGREFQYSRTKFTDRRL